MADVPGVGAPNYDFSSWAPDYDLSHYDQQNSRAFDARDNAEEIKTQFLTLLVAQMKHQDPMNPVDNQDFVAQLATFSSLEQLITIGQGMDDLTGGLKYLNDGVDYIATLLTYVTIPGTEDEEETSQGEPAEGKSETPGEEA